LKKENYVYAKEMSKKEGAEGMRNVNIIDDVLKDPSKILKE
jgi:hypothetical protein